MDEAKQPPPPNNDRKKFVGRFVKIRAEIVFTKILRSFFGMRAPYHETFQDFLSWSFVFKEPTP